MSNPRTTTNCPADETLAAFIDGRLEPEARRNVMEHVANCENCYAVASAAWDYQQEERAEAGVVVARPQFRRRTFRILAVAAALAGVMLLIPAVRERLLSRGTSMESLARASASLDYRVIEPRLSGGFEYRPKARVMRGAGEETADQWRIMRVASDAQKAAERNPTPAALQTSGAAKLLLGEAQDAVRMLEDAVRRATGQPDINKAIEQSRDAQLLSDLSAAYYVLGQREDRAQDLARAANAAARARRLDPHSAEAAWNRAVALDAMNVSAAARQAWMDYLALDSTSPWAAEARQRLENLQPPLSPR